jgi:hypothetical protein
MEFAVYTEIVSCLEHTALIKEKPETEGLFIPVWNLDEIMLFSTN